MTAAEPRLAHLSTRWTWVALAHHGPADLARAAVDRLLARYRPAAVRYLRAAVRDPHAADDLAQEFAVKLTRGDFHAARPDKGRFRDYLRTVLARLAADHRRRTARDARTGGAVPEVACPPDEPGDDRAFLAVWREELFEQAWAGLRRAEAETGRPVCTVLRLRADEPDLASARLAERLTALGRGSYTGGMVRKLLMEARDRFTDLVVGEVAGSIDRPTAEAVAAELELLGLFPACRAAFTRRWPAG